MLSMLEHLKKQFSSLPMLITNYSYLLIKAGQGSMPSTWQHLFNLAVFYRNKTALRRQFIIHTSH